MALANGKQQEVLVQGMEYKNIASAVFVVST